MNKTEPTAKSPSNRRALMTKGLNALLKEDEVEEKATVYNEVIENETVAVSEKAEKKTSKPKKEAEQMEATATEDRVTLQIDTEIYKKIKIMAHWELATIKETINSALKQTIVQYEKTHGPLVKVPKSKSK